MNIQKMRFLFLLLLMSLMLCLFGCSQSVEVGGTVSGGMVYTANSDETSVKNDTKSTDSDSCFNSSLVEGGGNVVVDASDNKGSVGTDHNIDTGHSDLNTDNKSTDNSPIQTDALDTSVDNNNNNAGANADSDTTGNTGTHTDVGSDIVDTDTNTAQSNTTQEKDNTTNSPDVSIQESPYDAIATAENNALLAERITHYVNQYRTEEGAIAASTLSGLSKYATYRSTQLVYNFDHDTLDERAAATALQYGRYTDPSLWGIEGEPYYEAGAQEAIVRASMFSPATVDKMARRIVDSLRGSAGHWSYVGASAESYKDYQYIAVGVTYQGGVWYTCVCVTKSNIYD